MAKFAATAVSLVLLSGSGLALAQDDMAAVKAENAALQASLASVTETRNQYRDRLARSIAYNRKKQAVLEKKLESASAGQTQYRTRLARSIAYNRDKRAELEMQLESATAGEARYRELISNPTKTSHS